MEEEAQHTFDASIFSMESMSVETSTTIAESFAEAHRARDTAVLYKETIVPQTRPTLETDQASYANGAVEFDRVMWDFRNLLMLELGYHQAITDLAVAVAKLQQAVGESTLLLQG